MKKTLVLAIGLGLLSTTTYSESHMQILCNMNGTPFFGTNYIQKVIHGKDIARPYWNPEIQPAPLSIAEIIESGKKVVDAQFPGYGWKFDGLNLMRSELTGWLYQIKYSIERTPEITNSFSGFILLVTPNGFVPSLVPDSPAGFIENENLMSEHSLPDPAKAP